MHLPPDLLAEIDQRAAASHMTRADIIRILLAAALHSPGLFRLITSRLPERGPTALDLRPDIRYTAGWAVAAETHPHQPWDGDASAWLREQSHRAVSAVLDLLDGHVDERARLAEDARRFAEGQLEAARTELAAERARALDLERRLRHAEKSAATR